jgi:hypothetical protein
VPALIGVAKPTAAVFRLGRLGFFSKFSGSWPSKFINFAKQGMKKSNFVKGTKACQGIASAVTSSFIGLTGLYEDHVKVNTKQDTEVLS